MPDFCTCGAQLPEDALFCHKCGKPQRDIQPAEPEPPPEPHFAAVAAPPAATPEHVPSPLPLNFRNPVAVRTASLVAVVAALLSWVPVLNVALWIGAGYSAAFLYRRRTGHLLNVSGGLRIGWITGVIMFAMVALFFAGFILLFNLAGGVAVFEAQFRNAADPRMMEALRMLQNGPDIAMLLTQLFVFITLLSMTGGALGAKLAGRGNTGT
jgi:hypothetical protein